MRGALVLTSLALALPSCADGSAAIGDPCAAKGDCASGLCMQEERFGRPTGFVGGYCVAPCGDGVCEEGTACHLVADEPLCLLTCADDADCRPDYLCHLQDVVCVPRPPHGAPLPGPPI